MCISVTSYAEMNGRMRVEKSCLFGLGNERNDDKKETNKNALKHRLSTLLQIVCHH